MIDNLDKLHEEVTGRLERCASEAEIEQIRIDYLGRKGGKLTALMRGLRELPAEERPQAGQELNRRRAEIEGLLDARLKDLRAGPEDLADRGLRLDVTLPGNRVERGRVHPLTRVTDEIIDVFTGMGFEIARGPDVEDDYHNFEALNIPRDHPARDMQDTFFVSDDHVLRTHTSPVQIRVMEQRRPPLQIIAPGAVYRHDDDATHSPVFHQVEGFMVDRNITFGDLKGVLTHFLEQIFQDKVRVRFRPSFFPFTEPSAEVDVYHGSGWLEILGSGMIDPNVFGFVGYDAEAFSGFAFGMGVERIAMLKYGMNDIRLFFQNDIRFLRQFPP